MGAEYARQLNTRVELNYKAHNFLQLNGLISSIIFIGTGIVGESLRSLLWPYLFVSSFCIIVSIGIIAVRITPAKKIKEIKVELDDGVKIDGKETCIMRALIKKYNVAQSDMITKHGARSREFQHSVYFLLAGLVALLLFIATVFLGPFLIPGVF